MQVLTVIFIAVTAFATGAIAVYANRSHNLASKIQSRDNEFRETIKDLFQAIVLSNLLSSDSGMEDRKKLFFEAYKGKTKIPSW